MMLNKLTESLNKMDFTQKPYKPTLYPSGRREEEEAAREGDANPAPNPEVVLPNNQDGDNPLVIPDREEDQTRDDYAVRVMQAVSQHQINSFNQMIQ